MRVETVQFKSCTFSFQLVEALKISILEACPPDPIITICSHCVSFLFLNKDILYVNVTRNVNIMCNLSHMALTSISHGMKSISHVMESISPSISDVVKYYVA